MSRIEGAAKPHLLPMILGQEVVIPVPAQRTVAIWAVLKAMTFEFTSASTRHPFFSTEERKVFSDTQLPPPPVQVFLAGYVGSCAVWARGSATNLTGPSGVVSAYASTASFGALVFQVFSLRARAPAAIPVADSFDGADIRIWPPQAKPVVWPPDFVLDQPALVSFATRWATPPAAEV
ncbi:MAG: hypothetical protein A3K19_18255 [Lentisphaerae bacterium RIFOXYB12_FULL_65_16]|nr:MAG: hypothetical protein A3K19_18255 [Lentisphaerae bacterium RIFOXYB12_FULL_65_16]